MRCGFVRAPGVLILATLWIVCCATQQATGTPIVPDCDPGWVMVDTLSATTDIDHLWGSVESESQAEWLVVIVKNYQGDSAVIVDPSTISFSGGCSGLDTVGLPRLFDYIAVESIRLAVMDSLIGSSSDSLNPEQMAVYIPTCVMVYGSGEMTTYQNIGVCDQAAREIVHATSNGLFQGYQGSVSGETNCQSGVATVDPPLIIE